MHDCNKLLQKTGHFDEALMKTKCKFSICLLAMQGCGIQPDPDRTQVQSISRNEPSLTNTKLNTQKLEGLWKTDCLPGDSTFGAKFVLVSETFSAALSHHSEVMLFSDATCKLATARWEFDDHYWLVGPSLKIPGVLDVNFGDGLLTATLLDLSSVTQDPCGFGALKRQSQCAYDAEYQIVRVLNDKLQLGNSEKEPGTSPDSRAATLSPVIYKLQKF